VTHEGFQTFFFNINLSFSPIVYVTCWDLVSQHKLLHSGWWRCHQGVFYRKHDQNPYVWWMNYNLNKNKVFLNFQTWEDQWLPYLFAHSSSCLSHSSPEWLDVGELPHQISLLLEFWCSLLVSFDQDYLHKIYKPDITLRLTPPLHREPSLSFGQ